MKKTLLLSISLLFCFSIAKVQASFPDVSYDHQNYKAIKYVKDEGIVSGMPDGTYKPDNTISRAAFTKIIVNSVFNQEEINDCTEFSFSDVPQSEWYSKYICMAKRVELINGYPDKTFRPGDSISFVESAKILTLAFDMNVSFSKTGKEWYYPYVIELSDEKVIPTSIQILGKNLTRGEMAEMIWRLKEDVSNEDYMEYRSDALIAIESDDEDDEYSIYSFEECESLGFPVEETYPRKCITDDGKVFVEEIDDGNGDDDNGDKKEAKKIEKPDGLYAGIHAGYPEDYDNFKKKTNNNAAIVFAMYDWLTDEYLGSSNPEGHIRDLDSEGFGDTTTLDYAKKISEENSVLALVWNFSLMKVKDGSDYMDFQLEPSSLHTDDLLNGKYDKYIERNALKIKEMGEPIMLTLFNEFDIHSNNPNYEINSID